MANLSGNKRTIIGCDIGNAYAYASIAAGRDHDPIPLIPSKCAKTGIPTDAWLTDKGEVNVYPAPHPRLRKGGVVRTVKRMLDMDKLFLPLVERDMSPWEVYAAIVRDLVKAANEEAVNRQNLPPVYDLVFTYPAVYYDQNELDTLNKLKNCIESVELDGHRLNVVGSLPEPAAAAIQYLNYIQHVAPENARFHGNELTVLVYDLGAGSFDLALVRARSDVTYDLEDHDGDDKVGGVDFDQALYVEICEQLYRLYRFRPTKNQQVGDLMARARQAKLELCTPGEDEAVVVYDVNIDGVDQTMEVTVTRARFEAICMQLLQPTLDKTMSMLDRAAQKGLNVDRIILTGGASLMPAVRIALQDLVGDRFHIQEPYQPSCAVSFGAALYGAYTPERSADTENAAPEESASAGNGILRTKTTYNYGLVIEKKGSIKLQMHTMVPKGLTLPALSPTPLILPAPDSGEKVFCMVYCEEGHTPDEELVRYLTIDGLPHEGNLEVTLLVQEDLNVSIYCKASDGQTYSVSTVTRK